MEPYRIGLYDIEKTIGKGNFSIVKLATHRLTLTKVAIKIIDKQKLTADNLMKIAREVDIMKALHHYHIVKLYQVIESTTMLYIVMEYVPNGEIFELVSEHGKVGEEEARRIFSQILSAVEYCHKHGIVHRDLKAENLLLDANNNIKLADFGFSNYYKPGELLSTWCGSPPYAAPEIFNGENYVGPKVDVWSMGVVLYVLVAGALPFDATSLRGLRDQVLNTFPRIPFWLSDDCEDLIKGMLCKNPERRFCMSRVKAHRWMRGEVSPSRSIPILAEQMKVGDFNEIVIEYMEKYGMSRCQIIDSLQKCAYDNLTAIYLLLGDKLAQHRHSCPLTPEANPLRRFSAQTERVSLKRQMQSLPFQLHHMNLQEPLPFYPAPVYVQPPPQDTRHFSISSVGSDALHRDSIDSTTSLCFSTFDPTRREIIRTSIDEGVEVMEFDGGSAYRRHTVGGSDGNEETGNSGDQAQALPPQRQHAQTLSALQYTQPQFYYPTGDFLTPFQLDYTQPRRASDGNMPDTTFSRRLGDRANGMLQLHQHTQSQAPRQLPLAGARPINTHRLKLQPCLPNPIHEQSPEDPTRCFDFERMEAGQ